MVSHPARQEAAQRATRSEDSPTANGQACSTVSVTNTQAGASYSSKAADPSESLQDAPKSSWRVCRNLAAYSVSARRNGLATKIESRSRIGQLNPKPPRNIILAPPPGNRLVTRAAHVAELADALASGASEVTLVQVQVLSWALQRAKGLTANRRESFFLWPM